MKTMTNFFNKLHGLLIVVLLYTFLLISCKEDGKEMQHPKPSENPIILTAVEQTKVISVENLALIYPENQTTDKNQHDGEHMIVGNEWITITSSKQVYYKELKIEVKENTSDKSRTYNLKMSGKPGNATLQIIQNGK